MAAQFGQFFNRVSRITLRRTQVGLGSSFSNNDLSSDDTPNGLGSNSLQTSHSVDSLLSNRVRFYAASSNSPIHHPLNGFSLAAVNSRPRASSSDSIYSSVTEVPASSSVDAPATNDGKPTFIVGEFEDTSTPEALDSPPPVPFPSSNFVAESNWSPAPVQVSHFDSNGTLVTKTEPAKVPCPGAGLSKFTCISNESCDISSSPARFYTVYSQPDVPAIQLDV